MSCDRSLLRPLRVGRGSCGAFLPIVRARTQSALATTRHVDTFPTHSMHVYTRSNTFHTRSIHVSFRLPLPPQMAAPQGFCCKKPAFSQNNAHVSRAKKTEARNACICTISHYSSAEPRLFSSNRKYHPNLLLQPILRLHAASLTSHLNFHNSFPARAFAQFAFDVNGL